MPPGQQDGPPERIARLAFSLQETTSAIPVVVRRAADASSFGFGRGPDAAGTDVAAVRGVTSMGESTAVGPQALLLAPLFTLRTELRCGYVPLFPAMGSQQRAYGELGFSRWRGRRPLPLPPRTPPPYLDCHVLYL